MPVYQGRYRGKVVEAHTGKKVGDIAIDGASVKDCPIITLVKGDAEDNKLFTAPEFARVQRVLGLRRRSNPLTHGGPRRYSARRLDRRWATIARS